MLKLISDIVHKYPVAALIVAGIVVALLSGVGGGSAAYKILKKSFLERESQIISNYEAASAEMEAQLKALRKDIEKQKVVISARAAEIRHLEAGLGAIETPKNLEDFFARMKKYGPVYHCRSVNGVYTCDEK